MSVDSRTHELLALIDAHRESGCRTILDDAHERAAAVLGKASATARQRMREAFTEERRHAAERIAAAQARLDTRRRIAAQHRAQALLADAWRRLPLVLQERWNDAATRAAWIAHATSTAKRLLGTAPWRIAHPADWPVDEQRSVTEAMHAQGMEVDFVPDGAIGAGLGIHAGPNLIDCTSDGLLAERAEIGAQVLYALERVR
jgi:hypothetical protein